MMSQEMKRYLMDGQVLISDTKLRYWRGQCYTVKHLIITHVGGKNIYAYQ